MRNKNFFLFIIAAGVLTLGLLFGIGTISSAVNSAVTARAVSLKEVSQQITAIGSIHSQQEAILHFQTGGKLVYLPFKQGDSVVSGQTIAQLDTYALQRQLTAALNNYRATRDVFDQTQVNAATNVLQTQQQPNFPGIQADKTNAINDAVKRILDETQGTLDNSVITVELANYALQLSSLTAPFSGIIVSEDVTTPNVTVTPSTSFFIADPSQKVFRAQVVSSDIDFVSVGSKASVKLDGTSQTLQGSVVALYPQKVTLPTGQQVYTVDIQIDNLPETVMFGQNGSVLIASNNQTKALMVPSWLIVGHTQVWVWDGKKKVLKKIVIGKTHGDMTEVVNGLSEKDKVIELPKDVIVSMYQFL